MSRHDLIVKTCKIHGDTEFYAFIERYTLKRGIKAGKAVSASGIAARNAMLKPLHSGEEI